MFFLPTSHAALARRRHHCCRLVCPLSPICRSVTVLSVATSIVVLRVCVFLARVACGVLARHRPQLSGACERRSTSLRSTSLRSTSLRSSAAPMSAETNEFGLPTSGAPGLGDLGDLRIADGDGEDGGLPGGLLYGLTPGMMNDITSTVPEGSSSAANAATPSSGVGKPVSLPSGSEHAGATSGAAASVLASGAAQSTEPKMEEDAGEEDAMEEDEAHPSGIVPTLQNVVATVNLDCPLELKEIALHARNAEYNPKRFAAVIMRIREPKTTALIFASGKMVCTGAKDEHLSRLAARKYARIIQKLGFAAKFKDFRIQNIVASCDVKFPIRLEGLAFAHNRYSSYEPELFPGLIYRMVDPKIVLLIFVSGKIVLTGAKIYEAFENIYPVLNEYRKT